MRGSSSVGTVDGRFTADANWILCIDRDTGQKRIVERALHDGSIATRPIPAYGLEHHQANRGTLGSCGGLQMAPERLRQHLAGRQAPKAAYRVADPTTLRRADGSIARGCETPRQLPATPDWELVEIHDPPTEERSRKPNASAPKPDASIATLQSHSTVTDFARLRG